jgi:hypothetical protein
VNRGLFQEREFTMLSKIVVAGSLVTLSTIMALTTADAARRHYRSATPQASQAGPGFYPDERYPRGNFGLPYSNTARHDPRDTNGD